MSYEQRTQKQRKKLICSSNIKKRFIIISLASMPQRSASRIFDHKRSRRNPRIIWYNRHFHPDKKFIGSIHIKCNSTWKLNSLCRQWIDTDEGMNLNQYPTKYSLQTKEYKKIPYIFIRFTFRIFWDIQMEMFSDEGRCFNFLFTIVFVFSSRVFFTIH